MSQPRNPVSRAIVIGLVVGTAVLAVVRSYVCNIYRVTSPSMAPTLITGDWVLGLKPAVWQAPLKRGDVVVFQKGADEEATVKRVVGLPGDQVVLRQGEVFVNEAALTTSSLGLVSFASTGEEIHRAVEMPERQMSGEQNGGCNWHVVWLRDSGRSLREGEWRVPSGQLFVLGDNRDASVDSREPVVGFVPVSSVLARIAKVLISSRRDGERTGLCPSVP